MTSLSSPLTWNLSDPGMGLLERAGLAALYMSLRAAEEMGEDLAPLRWKQRDLTPESVTLRWDGSDEAAITRLMRWAWQVRDGVFYLPAVHREAKQRDFAFIRVAGHNGILKTFLQHVNTQIKGDLNRVVEPIREGEELSFHYQSLDPAELARKAGSRKKAAKAKAGAKASDKKLGSGGKKTRGPKELLRPIADLADKKFFTSKGGLSRKTISLSSWVMPGIAPRFGDEEAWSGPAKLGLLLILAPIACLFQHLKGKGDNWIFVVPDVADIAEFDEARPALGLDPTHVDIASLGDAGLRFSAEYATRAIRRESPVGCLVVAMGKVEYYGHQRVRKGVLEVSPKLESVRRFTYVQHALPNRPVPIKSGTASDALGEDGDAAEGELARDGKRPNVFYVTPAGRGRIADNLIAGRPWYADLFTPLAWDLEGLERERKRNPGISHERLWFRNLSCQKELLMELIQEKEMWNGENDRLFVEAFWDTLRSLYAQEADAARRGGSRTAQKRIEHFDEDVFRRLMRSKTRDLLRETLVELFAKAGRQKTVRENPAAVWNLIDHPHAWKRARDLALLALATYTKKSDPKKDDGPAPAPSSQDQGDDA
jgi:CRISPR-associated protein Cas8a1/Csx13